MPPYSQLDDQKLSRPIINSQNTLRKLRWTGIAIIFVFLVATIITNDSAEARMSFVLPTALLVISHAFIHVIEQRVNRPGYRLVLISIYELSLLCLIWVALLDNLSSTSILLLSPFVILAGVYLPTIGALLMTAQAAIILVAAAYLNNNPAAALLALALGALGIVAAILWRDEVLFQKKMERDSNLQNQLLRDLTLGFDRDSILEHITAFFLKTMPESSGLIVSRDHEEHPYRVIAAWGYDGQPAFEFWPNAYGEQGFTGIVLATQQSLTILDAQAETELQPKYDQITGMGPLRSYLGMPLLVDGELLGALVITGPKPDMFPGEPTTHLTRVCDALAMNLFNARKVGLFRGIEEILQSSPLAAVLANKYGGIEAANDEARKLLGFPGDEIFDASVVQIWGDVKSARDIRRLMEASPGGVQNQKVTIYNRSGRRIEVLFSGQMLYEPTTRARRGSIGYFKTLEDYNAQAQKLSSFTAVDQAVLHAISANDHQEMAERFLNASSEILGTDSMHIRMLDETLNFLDLIYGIGPYPTVAIPRKRLGHYVSGTIVEQNQSVVVNDTRLDDYTKKMLLTHQGEPIESFLNRYLSYMVVPLNVGGETIGTFHAEAVPSEYFLEEREQLMTLMANRIAPVLQNALLNERMSARVELLKRLATSTRSLLESEAIGTHFHQAVVDIGRALLDTEDCTLFLATPDGSYLEIAASTTIPKGLWENYRVPISSDAGEGLHAAVAASGQPLSTADESEKDLLSWNPAHAAHWPHLPSATSRAQLLVPLPGIQSPLMTRGVLKVENLRGHGELQAFSVHQQETLGLYAIQVAGLLAAQDTPRGNSQTQ